jgi:hypothetical protein
VRNCDTARVVVAKVSTAGDSPLRSKLSSALALDLRPHFARP